MKKNTQKIASMLDDLAHSLEERGNIEIASKLDQISQLVITADDEVFPEVSALAEDLKKHFDIDTEEALHLAARLFSEYGKREDTESGEEKEGSPFPTSALPNKDHRLGPRVSDETTEEGPNKPGTAVWWEKV